MKIGYLLTCTVALSLCASAPALAAQNAAASTTCDRDCLKNAASAYIAALVAHDPKKAPLAANFKLVENLKVTTTSQGLWSTASAAPAGFQIFVPDPTAQQVGYIGVLQSGGKPAQIGMRLKLEGGRIVEAEHVVVFSLRPELLKNLETPRKAFAVPVPEAYRDRRERLLKIGASYYDALDNNNGRLAPFADDCVRFENGMQTSRLAGPSPLSTVPSLFGSAGLGCEAQLDTQSFEYITTIGNRRVWIADVDNGLAIGFSQFHHAMEKKEYALYNVPGQDTMKLDYAPFDMPAVHIFKIWGGKIHEIEALGTMAPFNSPSGW